MPHDSEAPTEERCHLFPQDTIAVEDFSAEGPILDIGGGGEGIIGLLKASQVAPSIFESRSSKRRPTDR